MLTRHETSRGNAQNQKRLSDNEGSRHEGMLNRMYLNLNGCSLDQLQVHWGDEETAMMGHKMQCRGGGRGQ